MLLVDVDATEQPLLSFAGCEGSFLSLVVVASPLLVIGKAGEDDPEELREALTEEEGEEQAGESIHFIRLGSSSRSGWLASKSRGKTGFRLTAAFVGCPELFDEGGCGMLPFVVLERGAI